MDPATNKVFQPYQGMDTCKSEYNVTVDDFMQLIATLDDSLGE